MNEKEFTNLDDKELIELLTALEGMDLVLEEEENKLKEGSDNNENEL